MGHDLGSTPLNEALIAALDIIPEFQAQNNVQIVNTMILTDGEASGSLCSYGLTGIIRDPKTKMNFEGTSGSYRGKACTEMLLNALKSRTGSKAIGIYLNNAKKLRYGYTETQNAEYKKEGFTSTEREGYTEYFIVKATQKVDNSGLEDLAADASYTRIKNAFMKQSASRVNSRILLNRVIDLIAC